MTQENSKNTSENIDNYGLWRLFDHTRFMIARLREKELDAFGLTPEQVHILDILTYSQGTTTINNIVKITQRKHNSISTQINRMARQGLVSRKRDSNDYRKYEISITKRGQALLETVTRDSFDKTFSCLSPEGKHQFQEHLNCLLERAYSLHGVEHQFRFPGEK
jgi:DNA-binding MarR family transcriptional regulator